MMDGDDASSPAKMQCCFFRPEQHNYYYFEANADSTAAFSDAIP